MTTQLPQPCLRSLFSIGLTVSWAPRSAVSASSFLPLCLCIAAWAQRSRTPACVLKGSEGILGPWLTTLLSFRLHRPHQRAFLLPRLQASCVSSPQGCVSSHAPALRAAPSVSPVLSCLALATVSPTPAGCLIHGEMTGAWAGSEPSARDFESQALPCIQFSSVQSLSRVRLFATPWTAARQASPSITDSRSLLKLMSIESVMPSNLLSPSPPTFNLSQHQGLFK